MKQNTYIKPLIQSILSVALGIMIWIVLFGCADLTNLVKMSDHIQIIIILLIFPLPFLGAVMAILSKKNNIDARKSIIYISAIGMIISVMDIFFYSPTIYFGIVGTYFGVEYFDIKHIGLVMTISIVVDIIFCVKYVKAANKYK